LKNFFHFQNLVIAIIIAVTPSKTANNITGPSPFLIVVKPILRPLFISSLSKQYSVTVALLVMILKQKT